MKFTTFFSSSAVNEQPPCRVRGMRGIAHIIALYIHFITLFTLSFFEKK